MIDTNLLQTIGFSIVTNFTSSVPVTDQDAPRLPSDLLLYRMATVHSPTDFALGTRSGANYAIVDGVVQYFGSRQNYFREQDPQQIGNYSGSSVLTSNAALE